MRKRRSLRDELIEFKPRGKGYVYGVRNGALRAYVYDHGESKSWEKRYVVSATKSGKPYGNIVTTNDLEEAKERAKGLVRGRPFRHFMNRL